MATTTSAPATTLGVHSEVGKLRKVMVCRPGLAHLRLTPDNCHELLFDDVIWVKEAETEHYAFAQAMRDRGIDVVDMHDLLAETLDDPEARAWVLDRKISANTVSRIGLEELRGWLNEMPSSELAVRLIGGITTDEVPLDAYARSRPHRSNPIRDPAAAEHAVHSRHHLLDLRRRQLEPDVLACAPAGDAARVIDLQVPPHLPRRAVPGMVR
jgi:hypothetical protein